MPECNTKPKVYRLAKGKLRLLTCVDNDNKTECKRSSKTEDSEKNQIGFYMKGAIFISVPNISKIEN